MASRRQKVERQDLLVHIAEFGVVICRECAFAIQPSALSNHILRHRIYREDRQELLDKLSNLNIIEPEHVPTPAPSSSPVRHLPVHSGFICNIQECSHACVSHKRMTQHFSDAHGTHSSHAVDARPAYLQTFFKGNKLKYFEVTPRDDDYSPTTSSNGDAIYLDPISHQSSDPSSAVSHAEVEGTKKISTFVGRESDRHFPHLDMDTLQYFNQYIKSTASTLTKGVETPDFWTGKIVNEAFKYDYLMYSLLSTTAFHEAMTNDDVESAHRHLRAALQYQGAGIFKFRTAAANPSRANSEAIIAAARMLSIQQGAQAQLESGSSLSVKDSTVTSTRLIVEFFTYIRGDIEMHLSLQDQLPPESEFRFRGSRANGMDRLTSHQLTSEGLFPFLLKIVIEQLEVSLAKMFEGQGYVAVPILTEFITDRDLTALCFNVLTLTSENEITTQWIQATIPRWPASDKALKLMMNALLFSVGPAKMAYQESLRDSIIPPFPSRSRFPGLPVHEYERLKTFVNNMRTALTPYDAADVEAVAPEIIALLHGFGLASASDSISSVFHGVDTCVCSLSKKFWNMVERARPVALLIVSQHCRLIQRIEHKYWFMRRHRSILLSIIDANLPQNARELL